MHRVPNNNFPQASLGLVNIRAERSPPRRPEKLNRKTLLVHSMTRFMNGAEQSFADKITAVIPNGNRTVGGMETCGNGMDAFAKPAGLKVVPDLGQDIYDKPALFLRRNIFLHKRRIYTNSGVNNFPDK